MGVYFLGLDVDDVHLLADALQGGFCAESSHVSSNKTMGILCHSLQIHVFCQFHVFSVDSQNLQSADFIRHTNIDLSVKTTESSESWVDSIGPVGRSDDNDVSSAFQAVHKCEHLGDNSSFDLTAHLFSVGCDGIDLVDEDNCWTVLFCLLESLSQVAFSLSSHL